MSGSPRSLVGAMAAQRDHREGLLDLVLSGIAEAVVVADRDGTIVLANDAARELFDVREGERAEAWLRRVDARRPGARRRLATNRVPFLVALGGAAVPGKELVLKTSGGIRTVEMAARPVVDATGRVVAAVSMIHDVTDRNAVARALAEHAHELARSNLELDQFAYVASHDLQEPLRVISAYCQLLKRRYGGQLDADADEFIGFAVEGAQRMQQLINDLLLYSRVRAKTLALAQVPLGDVVAAAVANLQTAVGETGTVIDAPSLPTITADRAQLTQVFQNLLANSIRFKSSGPPYVRVAVEEVAKEWLVSVTDNGVGIEPRYADRIFTIFQRLNPREASDGSGIGLAICRRVIERHGGRIWLDPDYTGGARFWLALPRYHYAA